MGDLLFDTPWWVLTLLGVTGAALLMSGNSRQDKKLFRAGFGVLCAGVALFVLSYIIDTPKEKVIKGTHALVDAVVNRDQSALETELHPDVNLGAWDKQVIVHSALIFADQFGLKSASISGMTITEQPPMIVATLRVFSRHQSPNIPSDNVPTDWQLSWMETGGGKWQLKEIKSMGATGGIDGGEVSKLFLTTPPK